MRLAAALTQAPRSVRHRPPARLLAEDDARHGAGARIRQAHRDQADVVRPRRRAVDAAAGDGGLRASIRRPTLHRRLAAIRGRASRSRARSRTARDRAERRRPRCDSVQPAAEERRTGRRATRPRSRRVRWCCSSDSSRTRSGRTCCTRHGRMSPTAASASTLVLVGPTRSTYYEIDAAMADAMNEDAARRGLLDRIVFVEQTHADRAATTRPPTSLRLPTLREGMPNVVSRAWRAGSRRS